MRVIGIVAEFNPFHNGHEYLIRKAREAVGDRRALVMICMSGPFTQRGEPSILPKHTRAEMALCCGADVVLELPFSFSCAPSSRFAMGAIDLFAKTGVVTDLAFGIDSGNQEIIQKLSDIDFEAIEDYKLLLKENLAGGQSFPSARANAIISYCKNALPEFDHDTLSTALRQPNSILALDYLYSVKAKGLKINIHMIPRLQSEDAPSATIIREDYYTSKDNAYPISTLATSLSGKLPNSALATMLEGFSTSKYSFMKRDEYIGQAVRLINSGIELSSCAYMSDGLSGYLANSMQKLSSSECNFQSLSKILATKHFTMPRIYRALTSALLGQTGQFVSKAQGIPYLRVLGFSREGRYCLKIMGKCACVPIISNCSDYLEYSKREYLCELFKLDLQANNLQASLLGMQYNYEWELSPIYFKGKL